MAKTLLEFEGKFINIFDIKCIEKENRWDSKECKFSYNIEINKAKDDVDYGVREFIFEYENEELRDRRLELLRLIMDDHELINIIEV